MGPKPTSLYRYFDAAGVLLYIGITSRRTGRSLQHAGEKDWWSEVARAEWEHFDDRQAAATAERMAITTERPRHNVIWNRDGHATAPRGRDTAYRQEAASRWPDGMDAAWDGPVGVGRWATVSWCAGMTVQLWRDLDDAEEVFCRLSDDACGHGCPPGSGDHELVDLDAPHHIDGWTERYRLARRIEHFESCAVCIHVFGGKAPQAARARHLDHSLVAVS